MIHNSDPFATPPEGRSDTRRARGRFAATVSLWTAYAGDGEPAGLTVSSTVVVDGAPGRLLGLVDDESELWPALESSGRFVVTPLTGRHRQLADRFAGLFPAPGGLFRHEEWVRTDFGPRLAEAGTWLGCRFDQARPYGWGLLIEATLEAGRLGEAEPPLIHYRGGYHDLD